MEPPAKRRKVHTMDNAVSNIMNTELTGEGCKLYSQTTPLLLGRYCGNKETIQMMDIIVSMEQYLHSETASIEALYDKSKLLFQCVTCFERRTSEEIVRYEREDANAQLFYDLGGVEVAKRIIMLESLLPRHSVHREESPDKLRMKCVLFQALLRIISTDSVGEIVAKELAEDDEFMIEMFFYLKFDQTFLSACSLLEDVLQNRPVLMLSTIPNLNELIASLSEERLMNFCKILAVTVSDLDVYDNKTSLFAQNKQKRGDGFVNIRDLNQEFLLQNPALIEKLVDISCTKEYSPRFRGLNGEVENWMQWIDNSNSDDLLDLPDEDVDVFEFVGGISQPAEMEAPWSTQPAMEVINTLIYKVETVHVLALLLLGKHRKRAQKMVSEMKLIPGLSTVFENFFWKVQGNRTGPRNRLAGHNASCECSPEVALKIQTMRVIHAFCDHSDYKHLLLTRIELAEIQRINEKAGVLAIDGLDKVNKAHMCKGKEGLITKIIEVMKKEPTSSTFRFWLARAVESYLRGNTSFCDQVFLLRRGVLQHVVNNMLDGDHRPKEILQSGFDLLGELMKFNIEAFKILEDILRTPETRDRFRDLINKNLVDSNMFIRSAILSFGFFSSEQVEHADYAKNVNYVLSYIGSFQHQVNYLHELIKLTTVLSVSQENVSCLNTAIVLLMCTSKSVTLAPYLKALKEEKITYTGERRGGSMVISNFRELLVFWKDHYLSRDKDCTALEKSTRIKFSEWKKTVETLIDEDATQPTSLLYYIDDHPGRAH